MFFQSAHQFARPAGALGHGLAVGGEDADGIAGIAQLVGVEQEDVGVAEITVELDGQPLEGGAVTDEAGTRGDHDEQVVLAHAPGQVEQTSPQLHLHIVHAQTAVQLVHVGADVGQGLPVGVERDAAVQLFAQTHQLT